MQDAPRRTRDSAPTRALGKRGPRSLQILATDGLAVVEFPQSPQRVTPATTGLYEAVVNGAVTHTLDPRLARHVGNATVRIDNRGTRM
jgi:hypothetical protein